MTLQARYSTPCSVCDEPIHPGDLMRMETPSSGWQHVVCPDPLPEVKRRVCGQCFTEVSVTGTCLCEVDR